MRGSLELPPNMPKLCIEGALWMMQHTLPCGRGPGFCIGQISIFYIIVLGLRVNLIETSVQYFLFATHWAQS
jgi:hypothetical protein